MAKQHYLSVYTSDSSLFTFVNKRAKDFKSRNDYLLKLIEMDRKGLVNWDGSIKRDPILEELKKISAALGIGEVPTEKFEKVVKKSVEIGENVSIENIINILTEEGIL